MGAPMKAIGEKTNSMALAEKYGQMEQSLRANTYMGESTVKEPLLGRTQALIQESL